VTKTIRREQVPAPPPPPPPMWVVHIPPARGGGWPSERGALSIIQDDLAPAGDSHRVVVRDGAYSGGLGMQGIILQDTDVVDGILAAFLRAQGHGHQLELWAPEPDGFGRVDVPHPVDTPR
jgi:hypothetical protein